MDSCGIVGSSCPGRAGPTSWFGSCRTLQEKFPPLISRYGKPFGIVLSRPVGLRDSLQIPDFGISVVRFQTWDIS